MREGGREWAENIYVIYISVVNVKHIVKLYVANNYFALRLSKKSVNIFIKNKSRGNMYEKLQKPLVRFLSSRAKQVGIERKDKC